MARRSEHSQEQIKEMILCAAEAIIEANGLEALTVRKVALDIGYTVGSIYMVFAGTQDLLLHVNARTLEQITAALREKVDLDDKPQLIRDLADCYYQFAKENSHRWRCIFEVGLPDNQLLPDWYQHKIEMVFAPMEAAFQQLSPEISSAQVKLAARALWCGVHGICMLSLQGNLGRAGVDDTETVVRLLVNNFVEGHISSRL